MTRRLDRIEVTVEAVEQAACPMDHQHEIGDTPGLQALLDGKQAAGGYAADAHGHAIGDISGLQAGLDAKAASAHSHGIANVTGLQSALDGKQAAGSYATVSHNHDTAYAPFSHTHNYEAAGAVTAHAAAGDPHPQYLTQTEGDARYALSGQGAADPWTWLKLAADFPNSTVTPSNVTGLSFAGLAATTYLVEALLPFQAAATTTGIACALDVPAGATVYGFGVHAATATTLATFEQVADAATTGASAGVRAANAPTLLRASWLVILAATPGTVQLQMRSEVAASAVTLKAGGIFGRRVI